MCTELLKFGKALLRKEYRWLFFVHIPFVSIIPVDDFTMGCFPKAPAFRHVVIEALYMDENGVKYCAVTGLSSTLECFPQSKLFTFTALETFMESVCNSTVRQVICRKDFKNELCQRYSTTTKEAVNHPSAPPNTPCYNLKFSNGNTDKLYV